MAYTNILQAVILGLIEGLTEYLPVSSTFHLIWASKFLGLTQSDFLKAFEVIIQAGAILAVVAVNWRPWKKVLVSFLPTAIIGLVLYKVIKNVFFESFATQIVIFILVGVLFIIAERVWRNRKFTKSIDQITYGQAVLIGFAQAMAVFPGVSRAGAVILAMMAIGVKRDEAARYSFLLAVPTLVAASALDVVKARDIIFLQANNSLLLLVGFIASFISARLVVVWFVGYLQKHSISVFGWYRVALGAILLAGYAVKFW